MDIPAIIEAIAPGHDGHLSTIALESDIIEQRDGTGNVCFRKFENHQIVITIDLLSRTPDAE